MAEQEHFGKGNFNTALKNKGARGIRLFAAVVPAALAPLSQADVATNVFKKNDLA